jgi:hypothetical protein
MKFTWTLICSVPVMGCMELLLTKIGMVREGECFEDVQIYKC